MLKVFITISIVLLFVSCKEINKPIVDSGNLGRIWNVKLGNDLGILEIELPKYYDTCFSWTQYSDCGDGCASVNYRVQPKHLPVFKESGFYWEPLQDSVEQFTIKHPKLTIQWPIYDTSLVRQQSGRLKYRALEYGSNKFLIDTVFMVGKLNIALIAFNRFDTSKNVDVQNLSALTAIDGNLIEIYFEYRKSYEDADGANFIKTSFDALKTIRITNDR